MKIRLYNEPIKIKYLRFDNVIVSCEAIGIGETPLPPKNGQQRSEFLYLVALSDSSGVWIKQNQVIVE